jgi:hypothetical protein
MTIAFQLAQPSSWKAQPAVMGGCSRCLRAKTGVASPAGAFKMLTQDGYRDRFWRGYSQLRLLLEGKEESVQRDLFREREELPSTWRSAEGILCDLLCMARLLEWHVEDVRRAMADGIVSPDSVSEEANRLRSALEDRARGFLAALTQSLDRDIEASRMVVHDLEEFRWRLNSARGETPS